MKWRLIVLAVLVVMAAAACADPASTTDTQPTGALPPDSTTSTSQVTDGQPASLTPIEGEWVLVSGVPLVDGYPISLSASVNEFGGRAACNQYGGSAVIDGDTISIGEMFMTEMGCEPAVMDAESAYLTALGAITNWAIVDGQLRLEGSGETLVFDRAPEVPTEALVGTTWILDTLVQDDMAFTTVGEPATLLLHEDGTVTGSTGCRDLSGTWIESDAQIFFPEFAADGECPDDIWEQDNLVVTVLGDGFTASIDGDLLSLTSMGNEGLLYRATTG